MSFTNYLRCPQCKKPLLEKRGSFVCSSCRGRYIVKNGIPIFVNPATLPNHLARQITYFEREDERRGAWRLEPWQARYVNNFLRLGNPKPGGLIVDNATGSGYMAIELAKRGYRVIATDLTMRELVRLQAHAKKLRIAKNMMFICCTSESLPIKSNVVDGLVANAILEHLPNEYQAVAEMTRVVKKHACVMVAVPIAFRYLLPLFWPINWLHDKRIGHLRRYTREDIVQKFAHFREVTTYYTGAVVNVICVVLYLLTKYQPFLEFSERVDRMTESIPYGASNIVSILKRV